MRIAMLTIRGLAVTLLATSLWYASAQPGPGRTFAFLVACGDYDKTQLKPVLFTVAEMKAFRDTLVQSGVSEKNVVFLHDEASRRLQPIRANILEQFKLLMERLRPEDAVIVALSGHGVQFKGDKFGYFCPLDARIGADAKHTLLPMEGDEGLLKLLDQGQAGRKFLIVNACRNNPTSSLNLAAEKLQLGDEYNEEPPKGTVMLLSCKQNQFSWFYPDSEKRAERRNRSLFMYHLTEAWKGSYAAGKKVTVDHVIAQVSERVEADAVADFNRNQIPTVKRQFAGQWELGGAATVHKGPITNSIGMKLTWIPPGTFMMGSPKEEEGRFSDEGPQHEVTITKGFHMGIYEVTQEEYQKVMGKNPSWFCADGGGKASVAEIDTRRFPVEQVSWQDAQAFCQQLSATERRIYRLPTEAEWEYACRAKTTTVFHFGNTISTDRVNYNGAASAGEKKGIYRRRPTPAGSFPANDFGLCDMHGNVWEWCEDWYDDKYYAISLKENPRNQTASQARVLRGGSWIYDAQSCRAARRYSYSPGNRFDSFGFRVVLSAP